LSASASSIQTPELVEAVGEWEFSSAVEIRPLLYGESVFV
jgi:hypothetical protein